MQRNGNINKEILLDLTSYYLTQIRYMKCMEDGVENWHLVTEKEMDDGPLDTYDLNLEIYIQAYLP